MKKILICSALVLLVMGGTATYTLSATDNGPADITMNPEGKKPSLFPHAKHQETIGCGECHHSMADGKQVPYAEGQKIQKCAECHNATLLSGKKIGKLDLGTMKGAGHGNCLACHKKIAKEKPEMKGIKKCSVCHPKKK